MYSGVLKKILKKLKKKKKKIGDIPACRGFFKYNFISQEKDKKKYQKYKESMSLKTWYFSYLKL